ncbi:MAG TPA: hypothetical protein PLN17_05590, partial [Candidatus Cloacimonas sp.]|nr:hypothetical protein [Candidatus Cloacimonas sp.]
MEQHTHLLLFIHRQASHSSFEAVITTLLLLVYSNLAIEIGGKPTQQLGSQFGLSKSEFAKSLFFDCIIGV